MAKKIIIGLVVIVALFLIGGAIFKPKGNQGRGDGSDEKPEVTANFVNTDMIAAITKFRSCQGHIVVPQDGSEVRSNMKHYLYLKKEFTSQQGLVPLYAPFDGFVADILEGDEGFSDRMAESRDVSFSKTKGFTSRSSWQMTILHIIPIATLKEGAAVKAGELVGHVALEKIPPYYAFDVTYSKFGTFPKKIDGWSSPYAALESVFAHLSPAVLAQYSRFGAIESTDFAIAKATRDAKPCDYEPGSIQFSHERDADWYNDWLGKIEDAV